MAKFSIPQWAAYLGELDEPLAGEDLRKSVVGSVRHMGFDGPQALDGVTQDGSVDGQVPREVSRPCMGPDPLSPAGGDRSGESAATSRKWAGAVLVHDSQGGSARAVAQQLLLTRPWMSPGCWRQPYEDLTGHLDGSSCMGHGSGTRTDSGAQWSARPPAAWRSAEAEARCRVV